MFLELQMQVKAFLAAQKVVLQSAKLCPPDPIQVGPVKVVIDRIEFAANALRFNDAASYTVFYLQAGQTDPDDATGVNVDGLQTQLAQDIVVWVTSMGEVLAHPNAAPSIVVPVQATIVMDLSLFAIGQEVYFGSRFRKIELGSIAGLPPNFDPTHIPLPIDKDQILAIVQDRASKVIPSATVPVGLLSLLPVTPSKYLIVNAGFTVDITLSRIALRVKVGGGSVDPTGPWINFFKGFFDDRLGGNEWSIFLDADYIEQTIQTAIHEAIRDSVPDEVQVFEGAHYSNEDGRARIEVDVEGIADVPILGKLSVDPRVPVELTVPALNTIQIDVGLPLIQQLVEDLVPQSLRIFLRLAGPIGGLLGALLDYLISFIPEPDLPEQVVRTSPTNVRFTKTISLTQIQNGLSPRFTTVLALDDGIALAGAVLATPFTPATLSVTSNPFQLRKPSINCGGAGTELVALFGQSPESFDILHAEIVVESTGTLPVYLCSFTPLNDPLAVFPATSIQSDAPQTRAVATVHPPVPPQTYYDAPYPCDILVKTTAGVRLVRLSPPPKLTPEDITRLQALLLAALANCEILTAPWWEHFHEYDPEWSIDPGNVANVKHLWDVEVNGIAQGETVALTYAGQQSLVVYQGRAGQPVRVSALVAPVAQKELSILHGRAPNVFSAVAEAFGAERPAPNRGIAVRQQLLRQTGAISLGQPCLKVLAARIGGLRCVAAVLKDAVVAFDVTNPMAVGRVAHWQIPGVLGALNWEGGLMMFGENGFVMVDDQGFQTSASSGCDAAGIHDAVAGRGLIYAALPNAVGIFSARMCLMATVPMEDCRSVLRVGGRLIAAGKDGIAIVDSTNICKLQVHSHCGDFPATRLLNAPGTEPDEFVAMLNDGSARLLRICDDGIKEAASFPEKPWFVDAVRTGEVLVSIAGNQLEIAQFGASATF
jgi:hypothetical protein